MGLFDLLFGTGNTDDYHISTRDSERAQASADYQANTAGGWFSPEPPDTWGDFDTNRDGGWW